MKVEPLSPALALVAEKTGGALSKFQKARLTAFVEQARGIRSEEELVNFLQLPSGEPLLQEMLAVVSVHKTDLFRDEEQLDAVSTHLLPSLAAKKEPLRVWSAGCATGEEVATLLILLAEARAHPSSVVLGTDISDRALSVARKLEFSLMAMRRVPPQLKSRYFEQAGELFRLRPELRARAKFVRHNLMDHPYPKSSDGKSFDLILCRNVLIYFTEKAFDRVVTSLTDSLRPGGALVLATTEPILGIRPHLKTLRFDQTFVYLRRDKPITEPKLPTVAARAAPSARPPAPAAPAPLLRRHTVEIQALPNPEDEGVKLFESVLEWAATQSDEQSETALRRALYLCPTLVAARYLLGLMLEQRGDRVEAAQEFRRALSTLEQGKAKNVSFFLNAERLKNACQQAIYRLG